MIGWRARISRVNKVRIIRVKVSRIRVIRVSRVDRVRIRVSRVDGVRIRVSRVNRVNMVAVFFLAGTIQISTYSACK